MINSSPPFPSTLNSDPFLSHELLSGIDSASIAENDTEKPALKNECSEKSVMFSSSISPIHSESGRNSDVGDWCNFDDIHILPDADSLLREEQSLVDSLDLGDLDWTTFSESAAEQTITHSDTVNDNNMISENEKLEKALDHMYSTKQWSRMNNEEKLATVKALSEIINLKKNLCEQMEIIWVLNPSAVIKSSDAEFAVDVGHLNDSKLRTIKNILKKHSVHATNKKTDKLPKSSAINSGVRNSNRIQAKGKLQKKQSWENQEDLKEIKMRQQKIGRQDRKEKRSGLFVHEKKIKKLNNPKKEDEDVNILE